MDNFGDNFDDGDVDPAAEFLAREQTQLAGLEEDLNTANVPIGVTQTLSNGNFNYDSFNSTFSFACFVELFKYTFVNIFFLFFMFDYFACYAFLFTLQLGSGSSFEIIDSAENQTTNTAHGELSDSNIIKYIQKL